MLDALLPGELAQLFESVKELLEKLLTFYPTEVVSNYMSNSVPAIEVASSMLPFFSLSFGQRWLQDH